MHKNKKEKERQINNMTPEETKAQASEAQVQKEEAQLEAEAQEISENSSENESSETSEPVVIDKGEAKTTTEAEASLMDELKNMAAQKEKEAKENLDKYQRTIAEFDNFRKRTLKEKTAMYENGSREVVDKLLPIIDNFERAMQSMSEEDKKSGLGQGIDMIYKQFINVLSDIGVEEIDAKGNPFDPNLHHAVLHEENPELGENSVAEVFQKGYVYKERVLRHAMVKVVN